MELKKYLFPLRRWWWLLVAATLVAGVSSFLVTLQQPPVFQAKATLMIGRAIEDPNPSASQFWLGQQLATSYADIANRDVVRQATMNALGLDWLPAYKARSLPNSQLIEIAVTDTSPERAQAVAAELANQLILQSPTGARPEEQNRLAFISQQLDTLETQIKSTQDEIKKLQIELGNMVSARQITDTQNQITALQAKLSTLQGNYANLLANTQGGAVNTLSVIEPATVPKKPIGPFQATAVAVASLIGFALAAAAAYLLEYLDNTLKSPQDVKRIFNYPILGYIAEDDQWIKDRPLVAENPRHPIAEAFRSLRTNLEFSAVDKPLKTILITSSDADEGKTSVAANLAASMAQADKKVVLIDADLRQPNLHRLMGIPNENGLSDVFRGRVSLQDALRMWRNEKIAVISGGAPPPNPAELLASQKMDQILNNLKEITDVVIVDGPPFLVTDAAVLSSKVDGVLVVARPGYTEQAAAEAMVEQLERSGARVLGVVLNRIPSKLAGLYEGRPQLYPYYATDRGTGPGGRGGGGGGPLGRLKRTFNRQADVMARSLTPAPKRTKPQNIVTRPEAPKSNE